MFTVHRTPVFLLGEVRDVLGDLMMPTYQCQYVPGRCRGVERGKRGSCWGMACETQVWNANAGTIYSRWQGNKPTYGRRPPILLVNSAQHKMQELFISLRGEYVCKRQPKSSSCTVSRYHDMHARARCRDESFQAGATMPFQSKPEARVLDPHTDIIKLPASASAVPRPFFACFGKHLGNPSHLGDGSKCI